VFKFLTRPCRTELPIISLREAVRHHEIQLNERVLMEKLVHGCLARLTGIPAVTDPKACGLAQRMRDRARLLAEFMGLSHTWELEVAALLTPIGYVTVPPQRTPKARANLPLQPPEQPILRQVPLAGSQLVRDIPRLESVAAALLYQAKHFDGTGIPDDDTAGLRTPLHAGLLKYVGDLLQFEQRGIHRNVALEQLKQGPGWYDPEILAAGTRCFRADVPQPREAGQPLPVTLGRLVVGHLLLADVETRSGLLIVSAGNRITETLLQRRHNFASMAGIKEPLFVAAASELAPKPPEESVTVTRPTFISRAGFPPAANPFSVPVLNWRPTELGSARSSRETPAYFSPAKTWLTSSWSSSACRKSRTCLLSVSPSSTGVLAMKRISLAAITQPAALSHFVTAPRSLVSVRKRDPMEPSGVSSASSGSMFWAPASMASPSGSRDFSVWVASTTPQRSKKKFMEPGCPSWPPLPNRWRMSGAVRFRLSVWHSTMTGTLCGPKPS
jgi:hypothetical protein